MKPGRRSDRVLLGHIAECIERIDRYTDGRDRSTFYESNMVQDAVLRNLQTLAESAQRLAEPLKDTEPATRGGQLPAFATCWRTTTWRLTGGRLERSRERLA